MTDIQEFLSLPMETLVILAAGYIGYKISYTGRNKHHRTIDIAFISLTFGLIAKLALNNIADITGTPIVQAGLSIVIAALVSAIWRAWIEHLAKWVLRTTNISYSDGTLSAWDAMRTSHHCRPSQLVVRQINGTQLLCDNLIQFQEYPHGPCIYGEDGSIAMYVTHFRQDGGAEWDHCNPLEPDYGVAITFIPARQIAEIEIRHSTSV